MKTFSDEGLLLAFLRERWANRGPSWLERPWQDGELPDPNDVPGGGTITLFRDQVTQWRDDYAMIVALAALAMDIPVQEFSPLRAMEWLMKKVATRPLPSGRPSGRLS